MPVRLDTIRLPVADVGPDSPLPLLRGIPPPPAVGDPAATTGDPADPPVAALAGTMAYGRPHSLLPYTAQDGYTRSLSDQDVAVVELSNEYLAATFLPGHGGRLYSLVHRPTGRHLLHRNPILGPANLALRNAWLAGGVEWNLGTTGHWPLTCAPLHAARLDRPDGTQVLRMYEFERLRRLVVQIDAYLPPGSPLLYVYVRVRNPNARTVPAYWWSNIAVPEHADTRVLVPASAALRHDGTDRLDPGPFPYRDGADHSYPGRCAGSADFFFDIPPGHRAWLAALDGTGRGLAHATTGRLTGRKLFRWGTGTGGRNWQRWLSGPDARYLEIQAGLARTQHEHLPLPAGVAWSWLEAYGMLAVDPAAVHASWATARRATGAALDGLAPAGLLERELARAAGYADAPPGQVLYAGSGWGALERAAGALPDLPGTPFPTTAARAVADPGPARAAGAPAAAGTAGHETPVTAHPANPAGAAQTPWWALLRSGTLPACDPPAAPVTGDHWERLLARAPADWHVLLHRGLLRWAAGDTDGARAAWRESLAARRTPWALRNLAESLRVAPPADLDPDAVAARAADLLTGALALAPGNRALAVEVLRALVAAGRHAEALAVVDALPPDLRGNGRIRLYECRAAAGAGHLDRAAALLDDLVVDDLAEGEDALDTLWARVHPGRPLPEHLDFRMSAGPL